MFCINCFHSTTSIKNSRPHKKQPSVWRRRYCSNCKSTFTTYERPSLSENKLIHLDNNQTEQFNLGKLIISIAEAFSHAPKEARYSALWLAQTIEDILSTQYKLVTPEDITAVAHKVLRQYDEMAAIQYAAKYGLISPTRRRGRPSLREHEPLK
jgi:transcriptional repressor NrdR